MTFVGLDIGGTGNKVAVLSSSQLKATQGENHQGKLYVTQSLLEEIIIIFFFILAQIMKNSGSNFSKYSKALKEM